MRASSRAVTLFLPFAAVLSAALFAVGAVYALGLRVRPAHIAAAGVKCVPHTLNRSAVLPGTHLQVSPLPGTYTASPASAISLLGAAPGALGAISVSGSSTGAHAGTLQAFSQGDGAAFVPAAPFAPGETVTVRGTVAAGGGRQFRSSTDSRSRSRTTSSIPTARRWGRTPRRSSTSYRDRT